MRSIEKSSLLFSDMKRSSSRNDRWNMGSCGGIALVRAAERRLPQFLSVLFLRMCLYLSTYALTRLATLLASTSPLLLWQTWKSKTVSVSEFLTLTLSRFRSTAEAMVFKELPQNAQDLTGGSKARPWTWSRSGKLKHYSDVTKNRRLTATLKELIRQIIFKPNQISGKKSLSIHNRSLQSCRSGDPIGGTIKLPITATAWTQIWCGVKRATAAHLCSFNDGVMKGWKTNSRDIFYNEDFCYPRHKKKKIIC